MSSTAALKPISTTMALTGIIATMICTSVAGGSPGAERVAERVDRLLAEDLWIESSELAPRCNDATFLRRVWLDVVGDIPSPEHITAFLLDPSEGKRQSVVRNLLATPQYGQNWARYWRDVLLYRRIEDRAVLVSNPLVTKLTKQFNENRRWNEIASEFVTALGDVREDGATAIIMAQEGRTEETAAEVSRVFLGIQIQCAQCHDHPWDSWTRDQFHELAAFFPRIALRQVRTPIRRSFAISANDRPEFRERPRRENDNRRGRAEHYMPDLDDPAAIGAKKQPKFFLTGASLALGTLDGDRRGRLAEWLTDSPWFATAYVNRMWAELVGEPFYDAIDDIGPEREAKAPQAVAYLSEQFAKSGYDSKWLMRVICQTQAYQRECRPRRNPGETPMTANVAQRLRGDQLFNALLTALGIEEGNRASLGGRSRGGGYGARVSPRMVFNTAFGFDPSVDRELVVASIPQALAMMNTPQINAALTTNRRAKLGELTASIKDDPALIDELYLRSLSRLPTNDERLAALAYRDSVLKRDEAFEDLFWALINSAEFVHRR